MAREHDGDSAVGGLAQDAADVLDRDRVESAERLVQDEQLRVVHERGSELHSLLVAERERVELVVDAVTEAEPLEPSGGGRHRRRLRCAAQTGEVGELLDDLHPRIQAALLRQVAEPLAHIAVDRSAVPADGAGVGLGDPEDAPQRGGLAGAVRAEKPEDLPGRHLQRKTVQGHDVAKPPNQPLHHQHGARPYAPPRQPTDFARRSARSWSGRAKSAGHSAFRARV